MGGVVNGGAWLTIDGRRSDIHHRDLDVIHPGRCAVGSRRADRPWPVGD
jgi:hypothetical protein